MPNSIELPKGYENVLMEAYRKESLTAVLESAAPQGNIAQMEQLGEFYYPVYSMGGLGDVQANGRLPQNSGASLTWKPISANYDRGTILEIDQKVDAQSFNLAFGNAPRTSTAPRWCPRETRSCSPRCAQAPASPRSRRPTPTARTCSRA